MAARDRFTSKVICPQCGQEGVLYLSEDDHPYIRNPHREVDDIEGEFQATVSRGVEISVVCTKCGEKFVH